MYLWYAHMFKRNWAFLNPKWKPDRSGFKLVQRAVSLKLTHNSSALKWPTSKSLFVWLRWNLLLGYWSTVHAVVCLKPSLKRIVAIRYSNDCPSKSVMPFLCKGDKSFEGNIDWVSFQIVKTNASSAGCTKSPQQAENSSEGTAILVCRVAHVVVHRIETKKCRLYIMKDCLCLLSI
jgi:hypothetical protein